MTHECPVDGCQIQVHEHLLMCSSHWRVVPHQLKTRVYRAWADGEGRGTVEHSAACQAAVAAVNQLVNRAGRQT